MCQSVKQIIIHSVVSQSSCKSVFFTHSTVINSDIIPSAGKNIFTWLLPFFKTLTLECTLASSILPVQPVPENQGQTGGSREGIVWWIHVLCRIWTPAAWLNRRIYWATSYTRSFHQFHVQTVNQWVVQGVVRSLSQSLSQFLSQSVIRSLTQPFTQSLSLSFNHSVSRWFSFLVGPLLTLWVIDLVSHSFSHSFNHSTNHSVIQLLNQSLSQSVSHSVSQSLIQ